MTKATPKDVLIEVGPRWRAIMGFLDKNGAATPEGFQVAQREFADRVAIPPRSLGAHLAKMEEYGVIHVQRTTVDGAFGSARAYNRYRLLMTVDQWMERAEHIERERRAKISAGKSAIAKRYQADAKAGKAAREGRAPAGAPAPAPARVPVDDVVVDVMAAEYEDASADDLYGW